MGHACSLQSFREEEGAQFIVDVLAMDDTKPGAPLLLRQASGTLDQVLEGSGELQLTFADSLRCACSILIVPPQRVPASPDKDSGRQEHATNNPANTTT